MATGVSSQVTNFLTGLQVASQSAVVNVRRHCTIAEVNARITLLPAVPGFKWRLVDWSLIATGGTTAGATGLYIDGTQGGSVVHLATVATAQIARSAVCMPNTASVTNLADGACFSACDENTGISVVKNGSDFSGCTHIDVSFRAVLDEA